MLQGLPHLLSIPLRVALPAAAGGLQWCSPRERLIADALRLGSSRSVASRNHALMKYFQPYSSVKMRAGGTFSIRHLAGKALQSGTADGVQLQGPGTDGSWQLTLSPAGNTLISDGPFFTAGSSSISSNASFPRVVNAQQTAAALGTAIQTKWDGTSPLFLHSWLPELESYALGAVRLPSMLFQVWEKGGHVNVD